MRAALSQRPPYLWVADNVPAGLTQAQVEWWCAPTANGRTLLTTRSRTWNALGKALDLDVLEPDEALALLTTRRTPKGNTEEDAAAELCRSVGYHPLALDVLGALVNRHPGDTPYAAWGTRVGDPAQDTLRLGEVLKEELPMGAVPYVGAVLRASVDGLEPEAVDLLRLAVSLADAPIPAELAVRVLLELDGCSERAAEDRWTRGAEAGQARSLLEMKEKPAPGFSVHALVRRLLAYEPTEQERIAELRAAAVRAAASMFDGVQDIRNQGRISPVVQHAERLEGTRATLEEAALPLLPPA